MRDLNRQGTEILPYPLQRGLVRNLSIAAEAAGQSDLVSQNSGRVFGSTELWQFL
jgi:nitronate monooxygenase